MRLKDTIWSLRNNCQDTQVSVGKIIDSLEKDIFGVLLLSASLIIVFPVIFIPGTSFLCSVIVLWTAFHIFFGRQQLWLPQRIRDIPVNGRKASIVLEKMYSLLKKLDRISKPRLKFMIGGFAQKLSSGMGMVLAATTIIFGFIPLMNIPLMTPIVFFGLGTCTGDGLMTGIGWVILGLCLSMTTFFL